MAKACWIRRSWRKSIQTTELYRSTHGVLGLALCLNCETVVCNAAHPAASLTHYDWEQPFVPTLSDRRLAEFQIAS